MRVYVEELPDSCDCCVCSDDCGRCNISGKGIAHEGRREDCPLKVIVHLSPKTSTNGIYVIDGRRMNKLLYKGDLINDLVYRREAEVTDTDLISRQAAIEEIASHDPTNGTEPYFSGHEVIDILKCVPTVTHAKRTETHGVCSDCISRQAVFCILKNKMADRPMDSDRWVIRDIGKAIESLPPVEPERPRGEWEVKMMNRREAADFLDKCRWWFEPYTSVPEKWNEAIDMAIEALHCVEAINHTVQGE